MLASGTIARYHGYVLITLGYSLECRGGDAFVDESWIEEGLRGRGIGAAALAHAEGACRALALHLEAERDNEAGNRLYRRCGFHDHDRYMLTKRLWP